MDKAEYKHRIKLQNQMHNTQKYEDHKRDSLIRSKAKYYHKVKDTLPQPFDAWNYDAKEPKCPVCNKTIVIEYAFGAIFTWNPTWNPNSFLYAHCQHCGYEYGDMFNDIGSGF